VVSRRELTSEAIVCENIDSKHFKSQGNSKGDDETILDENRPIGSIGTSGGTPGELDVGTEDAMGEIPSRLVYNVCG
jgi:hypothetical protein